MSGPSSNNNNNGNAGQYTGTSNSKDSGGRHHHQGRPVPPRARGNRKRPRPVISIAGIQVCAPPERRFHDPSSSSSSSNNVGKQIAAGTAATVVVPPLPPPPQDDVVFQEVNNNPATDAAGPVPLFNFSREPSWEDLSRAVVEEQEQEQAPPIAVDNSPAETAPLERPSSKPHSPANVVTDKVMADTESSLLEQGTFSDNENDDGRQKKKRRQQEASEKPPPRPLEESSSSVLNNRSMDRAACLAEEEELMHRLDLDILRAEEEDIMRRLDLDIQAAESAEAAERVVQEQLTQGGLLPSTEFGVFHTTSGGPSSPLPVRDLRKTSMPGSSPGVAKSPRSTTDVRAPSKSPTTAEQRGSLAEDTKTSGKTSISPARELRKASMPGSLQQTEKSSQSARAPKSTEVRRDVGETSSEDAISDSVERSPTTIPKKKSTADQSSGSPSVNGSFDSSDRRKIFRTTFLRRPKMLNGGLAFTQEEFQSSLMDPFIDEQDPSKLLDFDFSLQIDPIKTHLYSFEAKGGAMVINVLTNRVKQWVAYRVKMAKLSCIMHDGHSQVVDIIAPPGQHLGISFGNWEHYLSEKQLISNVGAVLFEATDKTGMIARKFGPTVTKIAAAIIAADGTPFYSPSKLQEYLDEKRKARTFVRLTLCFHKDTDLSRGSGALPRIRRLRDEERPSPESKLYSRSRSDSTPESQPSSPSPTAMAADDGWLEYAPPRFIYASALPTSVPENKREIQERIVHVLEDEKSVELEVLMPAGDVLGAQLFFSEKTGGVGWLYSFKAGGSIENALGKEFGSIGVVLRAVNNIEVFSVADFKKAKENVGNNDCYTLSLICYDGIDLSGVDRSRLAKPPRRRNGEKYPLHLYPQSDAAGMAAAVVSKGLKRPTSIDSVQVREEVGGTADAHPTPPSTKKLRVLPEPSPREQRKPVVLAPLPESDDRLSANPTQSNLTMVIPRRSIVASNPTKEASTANQSSANRPNHAVDMSEETSPRGDRVSIERNGPEGAVTACDRTEIHPLKPFDGQQIISLTKFNRHFMPIIRSETRKLFPSTFDSFKAMAFNKMLGKSKAMELHASGDPDAVSFFFEKASSWIDYMKKIGKLIVMLKDPNSLVLDIRVSANENLGIKFIDTQHVLPDHIIDIHGGVWFELLDSGFIPQKLGPVLCKNPAAAIIAVNGDGSFSCSRDLEGLLAQQRKEKATIIITLCFFNKSILGNKHGTQWNFRKLGGTEFYHRLSGVQVSSHVARPADDTLLEYPPPDFIPTSALPKSPPKTVTEMQEAANKILSDEKSVEVEFLMPTRSTIGARLQFSDQVGWLYEFHPGGPLAAAFGKNPGDWFVVVLSLNGVRISGTSQFTEEKVKAGDRDTLRLRVACFDGVDLSDVDHSRLVSSPRRRNGEKYPMHLYPKESKRTSISEHVTRDGSKIRVPPELDAQLDHVPVVYTSPQGNRSLVSTSNETDDFSYYGPSTAEVLSPSMVSSPEIRSPNGDTSEVTLLVPRLLKQFNGLPLFNKRTFEADVMDLFRRDAKKKNPSKLIGFKYKARISSDPDFFELKAQGDAKLLESLTKRVKAWGMYISKVTMLDLLFGDPQSIVVDISTPAHEVLGISFINTANLAMEHLQHVQEGCGGVSFKISSPSGLIARELGQNVSDPVAAIIAVDDHFPCTSSSVFRKLVNEKNATQPKMVITICIPKFTKIKNFHNPEMKVRRLGDTVFYHGIRTLLGVRQRAARGTLAEEAAPQIPREPPNIHMNPKEVVLNAPDREHTQKAAPGHAKASDSEDIQDQSMTFIAVEKQRLDDFTRESSITKQTKAANAVNPVDDGGEGKGSLSMPVEASNREHGESPSPQDDAGIPPNLLESTSTHVGNELSRLSRPIPKKTPSSLAAQGNNSSISLLGTNMKLHSNENCRDEHDGDAGFFVHDNASSDDLPDLQPLGRKNAPSFKTPSSPGQKRRPMTLTETMTNRTIPQSKVKAVASAKSEIFEHSFDATQPLGAFFVTEMVDIFKMCKVQSIWFSGQAARNSRIRPGTIVESVIIGTSRQRVRGHRELCKFYEDAARVRSRLSLVLKNPESVSEVYTSVDKDWTFDGKWQGGSLDGWAGGSELSGKYRPGTSASAVPSLQRQPSGVNALVAPSLLSRTSSPTPKLPRITEGRPSVASVPATPVVGEIIAIETKPDTPGREPLARKRSISFGPSTAVIIPAHPWGTATNGTARHDAPLDLTESDEEEAPAPPTTPLMLLQDAVRNRTCKELIQVLESGASRDADFIEKGLRESYDEVKKLISEATASKTIDVHGMEELVAKKTVLNIYVNSMLNLERVFSLEHLSCFELRVLNMDLRWTDDSMTRGQWMVYGRIQVRAGLKTESLANVKTQELRNFIVFEENDIPKVKVTNNSHMPMEPRRHFEVDIRKTEKDNGGNHQNLCRFDISLNDIELDCPNYDQPVPIEIPVVATNPELRSGELTIEVQRVRLEKDYVSRKSHDAAQGLSMQLDNIARFNEGNHDLKLNPNIEGRNGKSILHAAVRLKKLGLIEKLGSLGAKVYADSGEVESPLTQAKNMRDRASEKLKKLEESGGDQNAIAALKSLRAEVEVIVDSLTKMEGGQ